jgi:hypothetical protein
MCSYALGGVVHCFMDHAADGRSRDDALGPPLCRLHEDSAVAPHPGPPSLSMYVRHASKLLGWWMCGLARPTPFFDDRTKAARAVPCLLTPREHAAL